ncbi:MAG TPA: SIMPL domain-containing protein [Bryobacteraceae bacterium]|jgi:hypothetical protein
MPLRKSIAFLLLAPVWLCAQDIAKTYFVRTSGEATVTATPDRAQVSIGVLTEALSAQAAASQNASQTSEVLAAVKGVMGAGGETKTTGYAILPQYQYENGHPPKIRGYQASNTVLVTLNELALTGKVIDAATSSGANNINGISFSLRDDSSVRSQALADATAKARRAAEAIAKALNVRIVGVLEAETAEAPIIRPLTRNFSVMAEAASQKVATPIEAGDLDVHASVTASFEIQR